MISSGLSFCLKLCMLTAVTAFLSCNSSQKKEIISDTSEAINIDSIVDIASQQSRLLFQKTPQDLTPRSATDGVVRFVPASDWTSGCYPGTLWYLFEHTNDDRLKKMASEKTLMLDEVQHITHTHDLGFMLYCSYGNAYRITKDKKYLAPLINGAKSLSNRYSPTVKAIRSWDFGEWKFPVIIDNMINLEFLFWATKETGDSTYYDIAFNHAKTTLENHFRSDNSSYHVIDYEPSTGKVIARNTHQGINDTSAWARGQTWGVYGFTVAFRETGYKPFLTQAQKIADFIIDHPKKNADGIPPWDYDHPEPAKTSRDASAAAVTASALLELKNYVSQTDRKKYYGFAKTIMESLTSPEYLAAIGENNNFILMHSTGNAPQNDEIDVPINYADYYFAEALLRYSKSINDNKEKP